MSEQKQDLQQTDELYNDDNNLPQRQQLRQGHHVQYQCLQGRFHSFALWCSYVKIPNPCVGEGLMKSCCTLQ